MVRDGTNNSGNTSPDIDAQIWEEISKLFGFDVTELISEYFIEQRLKIRYYLKIDGFNQCRLFLHTWNVNSVVVFVLTWRTLFKDRILSKYLLK